MPTIVLLLVFILEIFSMLDTFLKFDESQVFGCALYGVVYAYLPISIMILFTIINCHHFSLGYISTSSFNDSVKSLCIKISGTTKDELYWDNLSLLRKLKNQKLIYLVSLLLLPGGLDFIAYMMALGLKTFLNDIGVTDCKPWLHLTTVAFMFLFYLFNLFLNWKLHLEHDLFKIKLGFQTSMMALMTYSALWFIEVIYAAFTNEYPIPRLVFQLSNSLCIFGLTVYPVYLSQFRGDHELKLHDIWNDKVLRNRFISLCESIFCGQYVHYLQEVESLDLDKPLQLQKLSKKYFSDDSPFYLDIFQNAWYLDLFNCDTDNLYTFNVAKDHVMAFLEENVVFYIDEKIITKPNDIKIHNTYRRFTTFTRQSSNNK